MPSPVSAICSAVSGGGSTVSAVQIGTVCEPAPRRLAVGDAQEQERRLGVVLVAEADQALDVVELDRQRRAHSSLSQASAWASLIVGCSRPSRMRWLRFSSTSASPG